MAHSDREPIEDITLLKASHMAEDMHEKILFGLCWDDDRHEGTEIEQLICIAADHLSMARHNLKLAYIKDRSTK
jgi:hypothetical protein